MLRDALITTAVDAYGGHHGATHIVPHYYWRVGATRYVFFFFSYMP